jgi:hypothetical protein
MGMRLRLASRVDGGHAVGVGLSAEPYRQYNAVPAIYLLGLPLGMSSFRP